MLLLDKMGIEKASFVGHHMGGKVATVVAAAYPDRVDKLVLSGPGILDDAETKKAAEEMFTRFWKIKDDGSHFMEVWQFWKEHDPLLPSNLLNRIVLDHLRAGGKDGKTGPYGLIAVFRSESEKLLSAIQSPTLILWGTNDLTTFGFPKENEEKVNKAIPRNKVIYIEGGTFAVINMMPEKFAQLVLDFLDNPGI